ncbi:MAG: hypothetical protein JWM11_1368 [Planctomycetaceae bacterium]|nr:hypothetical protein [Planctomycetaceae bacterium]
MDQSECWHDLFMNWAPKIPRQGILVTAAQETIPFINFMTSRGVLLVERDRPDGNGARKVMVAYSAILAVKLTTTLDLPEYRPMGFE